MKDTGENEETTDLFGAPRQPSTIVLTELVRWATFGVTDGTSIIANGVITPKGSFWQKEIFNAAGNITDKVPRGSP